jgi:anaerobic dimethyl sulfoxide reductase subunit A
MTEKNFLTKTLTETVMTRRSFLKWSAALGGAAALAGGISYGLKATEKAAAVTDEGEWIVAACWNNCGGRCPNYVLVKDGVVIRQKADDTHEDDWLFPQQRGCARGRARRQECFGADRLKYPMKRKNWEPGGGKKELRGQDEWVRISWDEALDIVASEEKRIRDKYGQSAIFYNCGEAGGINRHLLMQGGYAKDYSTTSGGTWRAGGQWIMGTNSLGYPYANDRMEDLKTDLWIFDGNNPAWSSGGNPTYLFLQTKLNSGAKCVWIDPYYNDSMAALGDEWIPCRPGTDHALFLGMAYVLITEDDPVNKPLIDWDFLDRCTVGFDRDHMPADAKDPSENFMDYVLGLDEDGNPAPEGHRNYPAKTPQWASEICGAPAERIRSLAIEIGSTKHVGIAASSAPARTLNQDSYPQMFMTLGWMTGHFGKEGSFTCGGDYKHQGFAGLGPITDDREAPALIKLAGSGVPSAGDNEVAPSANTWTAMPKIPGININENELPDAVLTGKYTAMKGEVGECNIQMYIVGSANTVNTRVGLTKQIQAMRLVEFVLGVDYNLTTAPRYADVVLPITHEWERYGRADTANREIGFIWSSKVTEPKYETRDPEWIDAEIGKRLGLDPTVIAPIPAKQQIYNRIAGAQVQKGDVPNSKSEYEPLATITEEDVAELAKEGITVEPQKGRIPIKELKEKGYYQIPREPGDNYSRVAYTDYRADPDGLPRPTASGKLEIHCQGYADLIEARGWTTIRPIPTYNPAAEGYETTFADRENKVKGDYPLQQYNMHYPRRSHSDFDNNPWLREAFPHPLYMNPADAVPRGIEEGDIVLITSRHGKSLRPAHLTERIVPGVVNLPHGAWAEVNEEQQIDLAGCDNILGGAIPTGQGTGGYNTCNVQVEKYTGPIDLLPDDQWPQRIPLKEA